MKRNPDFQGHKLALNLANRRDMLSVSDCKFCGHAIAWATSKRTGKRYPVNVYPKQDMEYGWNNDVLRAAPWYVHTRESCKKNQDRDAEMRKAMDDARVS